MAEIWSDLKKKMLESIQRRILHRDRGLMGEVVARGHSGYFRGELIFDKPFPDIRYEIVSAIPEGDVKVVEKTKINVGMKFRD